MTREALQPNVLAGRRPLDTIIQAATVDVFQHYGVFVAPGPRNSAVAPPPFPEASASINFSSLMLSGSLSLSIPQDVFPLIRLGSGREILPRDCVREFTNQLMGRVKSRLIHFQVVLDIGLPSLTSAEVLQSKMKRSPNARVFIFATLKGDVVVSLDGALDEKNLKYVGKEDHGSEGDIILF